MTVRARVIPKWPIIVEGAGGVTVTQSGGRAVIGLPEDLADQVAGAINTPLQTLSDLATTGIVRRTGTNSWTAGDAVTFAELDADDVATQAEAETGTDNTTLMTPLRVAQAMATRTLPVLVTDADADEKDDSVTRLAHYARAEFQIDASALTKFGDMTAQAGLAAAFDGETSETATNTASKTLGGSSPGTGYVGFELATATVFAGAIVYGASNGGFMSQNNAMTLNIYGSNSTPSTSSDGTLLGTSGEFTDTSDGSGGIEIESNGNLNRFTHFWVEYVRGAVSGNFYCAELVIFEHKSVGVVRSPSSRAGDVLNLRDYGVSRLKTDNHDAIEDAFTHAGEIGGVVYMPSGMGTLDIGSQVAVSTAQPWGFVGHPDSVLYWPSGASSLGLAFTCGVDCNGIVWQGGEIRTGASVTAGTTGLYLDWASQINAANVDKIEYGTNPSSVRRAAVGGLMVQGDSVTDSAFCNGIIMNLGKHVEISGCTIRGQRSGTYGASTDIPNATMGTAIGFISRDNIARSITGITLASDPTITYSGSGHPAEGVAYSFWGTGMKSLDGMVFEAYDVNTGAGTFKARYADTSGESAYGGSGGTFEGAPQVTIQRVYDNVIVFHRTALYAGRCEGTRAVNNDAYQCLYGFVKQLDIGLYSTGNYWNCAVTGIRGEQCTGVRIGDTDIYANQETVSGGTVTKGVDLAGCNRVIFGHGNLFTQQGSTLRLDPIILHDCGVAGTIDGQIFLAARDACIQLTGDTADIAISGRTNVMERDGAKAPGRLISDTSTGVNDLSVGLEQRTVTTSGTTTGTLATYTLKDDITVRIRAFVTGTQDDGSDRAGYEIVGTVYRNGGGATIQSQNTVQAHESNANWDAVFDVSGNDIRIRVTGDTGETVNWRGGFTLIA